MAGGLDLHALSGLGPLCPVPGRISHSHWMSHIPFAFWLTDILRPHLFVELGSYTGVSFCAFCQQIENLHLSCEAYAIDTWQGDDNMGGYPDSVHADLAAYVAAHYAGFASLVKSRFEDALAQFVDGSIDLLHIDGYHSAEAMLADFEMWLPKMSDRGVILMHDIAARLPGYGGVRAWQKIKARFPVFAFRHGYGLGMVLTGKNAPEPLQAMAELNEEDALLLADRFRRQGEIYEKLFWLEEERKREAGLALARERQAAERENQIRAENAELRRLLEEERLRRVNEREQLREEMHKLHLHSVLTEKGYESSLSWRVTAPLRKIAGLFRN